MDLRPNGTLRWIGRTAVAVSVIWAFAALAFLPARIPVHFGIRGQVLGTGPRWMILAIGAIGPVLYAGLVLVQRFIASRTDPSDPALRFPGPRTASNLRRQAALIVRFLEVLKTLIALLGAAAVVETTLVAWAVIARLTPLTSILPVAIVAWAVIGTWRATRESRRIAREEATSASGARDGA
jgi:uncharacterized membrane protein